MPKTHCYVKTLLDEAAITGQDFSNEKPSHAKLQVYLLQGELLGDGVIL